MKFVSSAVSVTDGIRISGSSMASGEKLIGAIIVDIPLFPHYDSVPDTVSFSQNPHKVYHFGDCEHFKISGTAYRPSNNGPTTVSKSRSVFGPTYDQEGVGSDIIARTTSSYESWPHVYGKYSRAKEGMWVFALAAKREGNYVFSIVGQPDLQGDYYYEGYYQFYLSEFRSVKEAVEYRSTHVYYASNRPTPRTSSCSPFDALEPFRETLVSAIQSSTWTKIDPRFVYQMDPIDAKKFSLPTSRQVFPPSDFSVNWGEMAADAYNSVPFFSSNGIAYANDLLHLKKSASQTLSLIKSFGKAGKYANKVANLFLSFYYGWRLFVKDTQELYDSIEKRSSSHNYLNRATSQRTWEAHGATYLATFQCYYNRYSHATKLDQFILDNDLALTPENIWDLIPFSFVVDWFTGIGDALESASNYYTFVQKHEIVCSGRSIKAVRNIDASKLHPGWVGSINCSYYRRSYTPSAYRPTFFFSNSVNPLDHVIEGSALIVSRR